MNNHLLTPTLARLHQQDLLRQAEVDRLVRHANGPTWSLRRSLAAGLRTLAAHLDTAPEGATYQSPMPSAGQPRLA